MSKLHALHVVTLCVMHTLCAIGMCVLKDSTVYNACNACVFTHPVYALHTCSVLLSLVPSPTALLYVLCSCTLHAYALGLLHVMMCMRGS